MLPRRYRDKERSSSPSTSDKNVVTSAPTFKADDKKPISVKAAVKPVVAAAAASSVKQPSKKIDLGAASTYGKPADLGINSPTHRNTHSADLFGGDEPTTIKSSSDIANIFDNDDFNPRAEEAVAAPAGEFGDFESAFGNSKASVPAVPPQSNDFADFSSAFTPSSSSKTTSQPLDDNFLFNSPPPPVAAVPIVPIAKQSSDITADLFGNNVITSAFASQSSRNDLLDDFADLKITTGNQGELNFFAAA